MAEPVAREHQTIRAYVEGEAGVAVTVTERVMTEKVLGTVHEVWNVRTEDGTAWWVVTNPTNLYAQQDFTKAGMALTYHLGVRAILNERGRTDLDDERREQVPVAWRKFEQAVETYNAAQEAEAYQAVGVHCREALLSLIKTHLDDDWVPTLDQRPRAGDFKAWTDVFALALWDSGRVRAYLRDVSERTWDLAVRLQHYADATSWDAEITLDATGNVLGAFSLAILRMTREESERCPSCGSYRVQKHYERNGPEDELIRLRVCASCEEEWDDEEWERAS